jgi:hypothetical protein
VRALSAWAALGCDVAKAARGGSCSAWCEVDGRIVTRRSRDFYETPAFMTRALLALVPELDGRVRPRVI